MKLFHGSFSKSAPAIKLGAWAIDGDNVFDGIFASPEFEAANSHGEYVHSYEVSNIADNSDLHGRIEEVFSFLAAEFSFDGDVIEALANAIADDEETEEFNEFLSPRSCSDYQGAFSWEMQRIRGRVAAHLGFDAVEMSDEHGTSYLIVNPSITAE